MIPIKLHIAGFLSYREPVELDFTSFDLACISGANGAGKSSLLDAITWSLFGQARKRDDALINLQSKAAEVALTFAYEGNTYRVVRTLPRGKATTLEFQVFNEPAASWKALTERTTRETQARIDSVLRLDYETFVNASFFLQGKADQFTQQTATKRKDLLGSILGLEVWETYRERTAVRRKGLEEEVNAVDGRMAEIDAELAEEDQRKGRLTELEGNLRQLTTARAAHESQLDQIRKISASLAEQRRLAETLAQTLSRSNLALSGLQGRIDEKQSERDAYTDLVKRAKAVESAYQGWQDALQEVARLDAVANQFHENNEERQPLLREIASERARLEEEKRGLDEQADALATQAPAAAALAQQIADDRASLAEAEAKLAARAALDKTVQAGRERQAELKAENEQLKGEMEDLKARIERLRVADGATCPLCGQELSAKHRKSTLAELEGSGRSMGDRFRANMAESKSLAQEITAGEKEIGALLQFDAARLTHSNAVTQLTERLDVLQRQSKEWEKSGAKRLKELIKALEKETFAAEARKQLAKLDKELARLGYDASAHDTARQIELKARGAEEEFRKLESAREVSKQIEGEIKNLRAESAQRETEIRDQQKQLEAVTEVLSAAEAQAPDLETAERELLTLREQENQARDQVGAARQKVDVLVTLRVRHKDLAERRDGFQQR
ncbi:MAG TPA: SMC family ATPase, partial [Anaerolineales bacterium]